MKGDTPATQPTVVMEALVFRFNVWTQMNPTKKIFKILDPVTWGSDGLYGGQLVFFYE